MGAACLISLLKRHRASQQLHMVWFGLALLLVAANANRELWNNASTRSYGTMGSNEHVAFGRVSLSGSSPRDLGVSFFPEGNEELVPEESDLDTSLWFASAESIQISSLVEKPRDDDTARAAPLSRDAGKWGMRSHQNGSQARQASLRASETSDSVEKTPPPEVLEGVTNPLVATDIWNRLTGWEFDVPRVLDKFSKSCVNLAMQPNNQWVRWKPADKNTLKLQGNDLEELRALEDGDVLVYLGKFHEEGYGSQLPLVKTKSILPLPPQELAELLMDSSRVQTYNHMSLGRNDIHVMQKGLDTTGGPFGDGETKIVRNLTKPPLTKHKMEFVTMMHARPLRPDDGVVNGGYLVVSRAVGGQIWGGSPDDESLTRNEILLGINVIQPAPSGDPHESLVTAVTHVYSPSVPVMLAGKVGVKGAIDFVKDIRKLYRPVPA